MHLPSAERPCCAWVASGEQGWERRTSPHLCLLMSGRLGPSGLSAALHIYLRQHSVCCCMPLDVVVSFKLWSPAADGGQRTTSSPSSTPASPAHGGSHCSGSSAPRQPPKGEGTSPCSLRVVCVMQQGIQWCPGKHQAATLTPPFFLAADCMWAAHAVSAMQSPSVMPGLIQSNESVRLCLEKYPSSRLKGMTSNAEQFHFHKVHFSGCAGHLRPSGPAPVPEPRRRQPQPAQPG